ncbi:hypothetical protein PHMEG_0007645 [Phytophthora megakarya]|uniref:Uncharacterized protein n=1 Tax=Phytophthora megakarya TaxID=4795 RepID=A0A225WKW6_9STRA|nr:hypothetical protein PHMEG_0007645 [Phytophthora megakarya]
MASRLARGFKVGSTPKKSERQELIAEVVDLLAVAVLEQEFDKALGGNAPVDLWEELVPVESNVEDLFELLQMILSRRYLSPRRTFNEVTNLLPSSS